MPARGDLLGSFIYEPEWTRAAHVEEQRSPFEGCGLSQRVEPNDIARAGEEARLVTLAVGEDLHRDGVLRRDNLRLATGRRFARPSA